MRSGVARAPLVTLATVLSATICARMGEQTRSRAQRAKGSEIRDCKFQIPNSKFHLRLALGISRRRIPRKSKASLQIRTELTPGDRRAAEESGIWNLEFALFIL